MNRKLIFLIVRILLVVALFAIILLNMPFNDWVKLKGGTHLRGKILSNQQGEASIRFLSLGEKKSREIQRSEIEIRTSGEHSFEEIRYGLLSNLKRLDLFLYSLAFLSFFILLLLGIRRWALLLQCRDISISYFQALRLTFMGMFFNNVVPGLTGGDLVKAYYIARKVPKEKTTAVISVFLDRIIGLVALAGIAGLVSLFSLKRRGVADAAVAINFFIGGAVLGGIVFFSKRIRKFLLLDKILKVLPFSKFLKNVDSAIFLYRYKKRALILAFLISILGHFFSIMANVLVGLALNPDPSISIRYYFIYVPIALVISSIPITPAGLGVAEFLYPTLFMLLDQRLSAFGFALCILYRMITLVFSLLGGFFLLFGEGKEIPKVSEGV